jgi:hypothetical protein
MQKIFTFPAIVVGLACGKSADSYSVCIFLNLQIYQIFHFYVANNINLV